MTEPDRAVTTSGSTGATGWRAGAAATLLLGLMLLDYVLCWWPESAIQAVLQDGRYYYPGTGTIVRTVSLYRLPHLAVCLVVAYFALLYLRGTQPAWRAPRRALLWVAFGSYVVATVVVLTYFSFSFKSPWRPYIDIALPLLCLLFRLSALIAMWQIIWGGQRPSTEPSWAETQPTADADATAAADQAPARKTWVSTVIAMALAMSPVLPVWDFLKRFAVVPYMLPGKDRAGEVITALLVAWLVVRAADARGLVRWQGGSRLVTLAMWLLVLYIVVSPVAFVLSAIPYGGGSRSPILSLFFSAAQLLGLLTVVARLRVR